MEDLGGLVDVIGKPVEECVGNQLGEEQARNILHLNLAEKLAVMFNQRENSTTPGIFKAPKG